jgi:hypothetical protein
METLNKEKEDINILKGLFEEWQKWPSTESYFEISKVWDEKNHIYMLLLVGWEGYKRIYSVFLHVEIRNQKFWIEHDQTPNGFACDLVDNGISKDRIVLAFKHPELRVYSEYAEAA